MRDLVFPRKNIKLHFMRENEKKKKKHGYKELTLQGQRKRMNIMSMSREK